MTRSRFVELSSTVGVFLILAFPVPLLAADEAVIQGLQTDVSVTKAKTDDHDAKIQSLEGGLPAEVAARKTADQALWDAISAIPSGPAGPQGPQGEAGPAGPPGAPGTSAWIDAGGTSTTSSNVGIGTASPTEKLDVSGNIHLSGKLRSGNSIVVDGVDNTITSTSGTIGFVNTNIVGTGSIGVGTTTPAAKLHIEGIPGVDGIMFPDGKLQKTAVVVDAIAPGDTSCPYGGVRLSTSGGGVKYICDPPPRGVVDLSGEYSMVGTRTCIQLNNPMPMDFIGGRLQLPPAPAGTGATVRTTHYDANLILHGDGSGEYSSKALQINHSQTLPGNTPLNGWTDNCEVTYQVNPDGSIALSLNNCVVVFTSGAGVGTIQGTDNTSPLSVKVSANGDTLLLSDVEPDKEEAWFCANTPSGPDCNTITTNSRICARSFTAIRLSP